MRNVVALTQDLVVWLVFGAEAHCVESTTARVYSLHQVKVVALVAHCTLWPLCLLVNHCTGAAHFLVVAWERPHLDLFVDHT